MTESNDDIFNHIKTVMRNHEEPYDEGAWERFKAVPAAPVKKGAVSMWKWAMAAAAVITGVFFLARVFNTSAPSGGPSSVVEQVASTPTDSSVNNIARTTPQIKSENAGVPDEELKELTNGHNNNSTASNKNNNASSFYAFKPGIQSAKVSFKQGVLPGGSTTIVAPPYLSVPSKDSVAAVPGARKPEVNFWKSHVEPNAPQIAKTTPVYKEEEKYIAATGPIVKEKTVREKNRKWEPSLYVSPLFGDLGIDMGYGVSVGYAITDKIKISSGVAYNKLSASRNYGAGPVGEMAAAAVAPPSFGSNGAQGAAGATGAAGASKPNNALDSKAALTSAYNVVAGQQTNSLQQVDAFLSGIDIPVEINYNISKKLYASAGVSGLVVINDNKKYTYVDNRNVKVSVETNRGALKEDKSVLFSEQNTTNQSMQTPTENTPFLGFYNISMGYRQKISGRTGVALEPFIKVPMKNVTQENLKYIGTGIRLKFDL